jgi:hypothetical protein
VTRIVFLSPFAKTEITGGIKTAHRHAELLDEMGFDACVYQPEGAPSWFESKAKLITTRNFATEPGDILVFPEVLSGMLAEMAQARLGVKKVLFCQAQFYTLFNAVPPSRYAELGFTRVACQSAIAKGFLERVLHLPDVAIIPCFIDPQLFGRFWQTQDQYAEHHGSRLVRWGNSVGQCRRETQRHPRRLWDVEMVGYHWFLPQQIALADV